MRSGRGDLHLFFFFNDTATTEIYTLSLHDALPICELRRPSVPVARAARVRVRRPLLPTGARGRRIGPPGGQSAGDRKSTRLNSSHVNISYAVFCLKKNKYPP